MLTRDQTGDEERIVRSSALEVTFRPSTGARLLAVRDRRSGRDWLVPAVSEVARSYGDSYTADRLVYGWDEMVPTIDECVVGDAVFPDHGELWAVPWSELEPIRPGGVRFGAECRRAPFTLEREISPDGDEIVLDYRLSNRGATPTPAFWAAHPFFAAGRDARLRFSTPVEVARIDLPAESRGETTWDRIETLARELPEGEFLKVRPPSGTLTAATIVDGADALEISWSGSAIRHLALVWDNRTFASTRALAVEPMTAAGDTPLADDCLVLDGGAAESWTLRLRAASPY